MANMTSTFSSKIIWSSICVLTLIVLSTSNAFCQEYITNQLVVKLNKDQTELPAILLEKSISNRRISKLKPWFVIQYQDEVSKETLGNLKKSPLIAIVDYDINLEQRADPNDPRYAEQWALRTSKIDELWNTTTGGGMSDGREIVMAILDNGFNKNHEDFEGIYYINASEIPNNGKDDDENGYVDDYQGVNIKTDRDDHPIADHGTWVLGAAAAKGNNAKGVSGVNWNAKVLLISGITELNNIISAYEYIQIMRTRYNTSNGLNGAHIVVSSYSGGIPNVFPSSSPLIQEWANLYDEIGKVGVLSFGATVNKNVNIDLIGDMPSTSPSQYFVGVTGLGRGGKTDTTTGYGIKNIDIAAPSDKVLTTDKANGYKTESGTSLATPIVAGVASLLYSVPCSFLTENTLTNPEICALAIKDAILNGVTKEPAMTSRQSTGGYLNAQKALLKLGEKCAEVTIKSERGALRFVNTTQANDMLKVEFISPNEDLHYARWTDPSGKIILIQKVIPQEFGIKSFEIPIPDNRIGVMYLSLTNGKSTVSKGLSFLE